MLGAWVEALGTALSATNTAACLVDRELRYVWLNEELARQNGRPVAEHLGRTVQDVLGPVAGLVVPSLEEVLRTGAPSRVELKPEAPWAPREVWLEIDYFPVRHDGEIVGVGVITRDVSALRQEQRLRERLLGVVGHDLRSPLAAVLGGTELLLGSADVPDRHRLALRRMHGAGSRMGRMILQLLDFAQLREGHALPVWKREVDAAALLRDLLAEFSAARESGPIVLTVDGDAQASLDPDRFGQLVANLVTNALQHGDGGAIQVTLQADERVLTLHVHNIGDPVPEELKPHLFHPFRRGGRRGAGLGLYIARAIAEAHDGSIELLSPDRDGVTVRVVLPR